jgi:hypothetical protein
VKRAKLKPVQNSIAGQGQTGEGIVNAKEKGSNGGIGSVQKEEDANGVQLQQTISNRSEKVINAGPNMQTRSDKPLVVSSRTSQKFESASLHADLIMESCSTGTSQNVLPMGFMCSTSTFTERGDSSNRGINRTLFDMHRLFSAKEKMFASQASVSQYRPRNLGGNKIMSVAPGAEPSLQWCPTGLTHTQKRRVQRLRVLEMREWLGEKWPDEWFNQDRPVMPTKVMFGRSTSLQI